MVYTVTNLEYDVSECVAERTSIEEVYSDEGSNTMIRMKNFSEEVMKVRFERDSKRSRLRISSYISIYECHV